MKTFLKNRLGAAWLIWFALALALPAYSQAQAPPGWGWVNQLGTFASGVNNANGVAGLGRDAAGNLYLLGTYVGSPVLSGVPTTSQGDGDMFLAKYTAAGALVWLRILPSSGGDRAGALCVEPSGRCTLAGYYGGGTGGNLSFANFNSTTALPGAAVLGLATVNGYYGELPFVAAVDATGTLLWADNPSPTYGLTFNALHRDASGNCYASANIGSQRLLTVNGQSYPPIGSIDAVLLKYLPTGQVAWARRLGVSVGSAYSGEIQSDNANAVYWLLGHSSAITVDQTTVGVNSASGANSLVKLSANNRVVWIKNNLLRVGSDNVVSQLLNFDTRTNALYLSCGSQGGAISFTGTGSPVSVAANAATTCIARCDTAGQIQWVKPVSFATNVPGGLPGPRGAGIRGFAATANGFTYATSTVSYNATTYYGNAKTYGLVEGGQPCVVHFNTTTNQAEWVRVGGTPALLGQITGSDLKSAVFDDVDNVYVAGTFAGTANFGPTAIASSSTSQAEIFLAKLDQTILTGTKAGTTGHAWSAYPNPTTGTVQLAGLPATAQVRIYDAQGRLVRTLPPVGTAADAPRTMSGLAPGFYLLQAGNTVEAYRSQRLVVQ